MSSFNRISGFRRIGDHQYFGDIVAPNKAVFHVTVDTGELKKAPQIERQVSHCALAALRGQITKDDQIRYFKVGDQCYQLTPNSHASGALHTVSSALNFSKSSHRSRDLLYRVEAYSSFFFSAPAGTPAYPLGDSHSSAKALPSTTPDLELPSFSDSFSDLARKAFQSTEESFDASDTHPPQRVVSRSAFVLDPGRQELRLASYPMASVDERRAALLAFKAFAEREYGAEKMAYIQHLYHFDLEEMLEKNQALTPEHIYRVNIGQGIVEKEDLQHLLSGLQRMDPGHSASDQDDLGAHLNEYVNSGQLPAFWARGLLRQISAETPATSPTVGDLRRWIQVLGSSDLSQLSTEGVNRLAGVLFPPREEREQQLTGRKIHGLMTSGYKTAGMKHYKPWIDQQQLMQAMNECEDVQSRKDLPAEQKEAYFYEHVAHRLVKYHLEREHHHGAYRMGQIISAPARADGLPQFFTVTGVLNNGCGLYTYTFEPLGTDSELPIIYANRSTASDEYARDGAASVLADINALNSPGYLGRKLREEKDLAFFKPFTLPAWSAYSYQAERLIETLSKNTSSEPSQWQAAAAHLEKALLALDEEVHPSIDRWEGLTEFVKNHDDLFQKLLEVGFWRQNSRSGSWRDMLPAGPVSQRRDQLIAFIECFAGTGPQDQQEARKFIPLLMDLGKHCRGDLSSHQAKQLSRFISDYTELSSVEDRALSQKEVLKLRSPSPVSEEPLHEVQAILEAIREEAPDSPEYPRLIAAAQSRLTQLALELEEHVSQKSQRPVTLVGHSLGGAISQMLLCANTSQQRRLPVPGQTVRTFLFDSPAINEKDAEHFVQFHNQHRELMRKQGSSYQILHSQAEGDIIALGGDRAVGTVKDEEELALSQCWLQADTFVRRLTEDPVGDLREFTISHEVQFLSGQEGIDFTQVHRDPLQMYRFYHPESSEDAQAIKEIWKMVPKGPFALINPGTITKKGFLSPAWRARLNAMSAPVLASRDTGLARDSWRRFTDGRGVFHCSVAT